jgi:phenylalanyl-tRNA synthetase beta chain
LFFFFCFWCGLWSFFFLIKKIKNLPLPPPQDSWEGYPAYPYTAGTKLGGDLVRSTPSPAIRIANPKGVDFETARCSLAASLLKTAAANKSEALPLRLFEVSDVVVAVDATSEPTAETSDVGALNSRRLCAVLVASSNCFESIHGLLDRVMEQLDTVTRDPALSTSGFRYKRSERWYEVREETQQHPSFLPGRCAQVVVMDRVVGHFGIVHPEVCEAFGIAAPTALLEMSVEPFV